MNRIKRILLRIAELLILDKLGRKTIEFFTGMGESFIMLYFSFINTRYIFKDRKLILEQMVTVGYNSIPLVVVTATFAGMVSAIQAGYQLADFGSPSVFLGSTTSRAIVIELGPVLTALVLAGRFGASIAAEIGTMRVTEQIDALETMAINPVRYLATPRIIAGTVMMPVLVIFADFIAVGGTMFIGYVSLDVAPEAYLSSAQRFMELNDILSGLVKATLFGASTAVIGCYVGFATQGGAEGVGNATIRAFVLSSAAILINDYLVASILLR